MEKILALKCPQCELPAKAQLDTPYHKFLIYTCPKCKSNVVYYGNRIDIISDRLLKKLVKTKKVKFCGNVSFNKDTRTRVKVKLPPSVKRLPPNTRKITKDDLLDLKILLETETDYDTFLSKI